MERLKAILVAVDRNAASRHALAKAYVLARHFGARLELFLCDAEHAYALGRAYDASGVAAARDQCLADGRRYLEALRHSIAAEDVEVDIEVACETPLYESLARHVLRSRPDLVVRGIAASGAQRSPLSAADWQIVRTCPVPLLVTRGRAWSPHPYFAAAVDPADAETPGLAGAIAQTAAFLAAGCGGAVDLVCSGNGTAGAAPSAAVRNALEGLARELHIPADHLHLLAGEADGSLVSFSRARRYDALVMGALTHRPALADLVGTLTEKLMENLDCDFLLVRSADRTATRARGLAFAGRRRAVRDAQGT